MRELVKKFLALGTIALLIFPGTQLAGLAMAMSLKNEKEGDERLPIADESSQEGTAQYHQVLAESWEYRQSFVKNKVSQDDQDEGWKVTAVNGQPSGLLRVESEGDLLGQRGFFSENQQQVASVPPIDLDLIRRHIFGPKAVADILALKIVQLFRNDDEAKTKYMEIPFKYLANFKITLISEKTKRNLELKGGFVHKTSAMYSRTSREFLISVDDVPTLSESVIRHELKHAAEHAGEIIAVGDTAAAANYYLMKDGQAKRRREIELKADIQKGNARIVALHRLLVKEANGETTVTDNRYLNNLRKKVKAKNMDSYAPPLVPLPVSRSFISFVENQRGEKLKSGDIVDIYAIARLNSEIRSYLMEEPKDVSSADFRFYTGKMKILGFVEIREGSEVSIGLKMSPQDPLRTLVCVYSEHKEVLAEAYRLSEKAEIEERDAYLFGDVPDPLVKEFFPELYKESKGLYQLITQNGASYQNSEGQHPLPH